MSKKIKLSLTQNQFDLITSALSEYSSICFSDSDQPGEVVDGYVTFKQDKSSILYKLGKDLDRVLTSIYRQKAKGKS